MVSTTLSLKKKASFTIVLLVLVALLVEGISWLGLKVLEKNFAIVYRPNLTLKLSEPHKISLRQFIDKEIKLTGYSSSLGWTNNPNVATADGIHITNSAGLRDTREFSYANPKDKTRITSFGDSFTYGMEVGHLQSWQQHLERLNSNVETLNFGVGAHGPDQAYIRYLEEGKVFKTDYVAIGYMSENIARILNVYRPFYMPNTGIPVTKPRYVLENGQLRRINNPNSQLSDYEELLDNPAPAMRRYGREDYFYQRGYAAHPWQKSATVRLIQMATATLFKQPVYDLTGVYNRDGEGFKLLTKLLADFYHQVEKDGAKPIILISPQIVDFIRVKEGKPVKYQPLLEWLDEQGYDYIDHLKPMLKFADSNSVNNFFSRSRGHYSSQGNQAVAKQVNEFILANSDK